MKSDSHSTSQRIHAIGDVHGCYDQLSRLIDEISPHSGDLLIFLGDYIDRGPDSKAVLKYCLELRSQYPTVFIKGNHEEMLLTTRDTPEYFDYWLKYGGDKTLSSYGLTAEYGSIARIPDSHFEFIEQMVDYYETEHFIFSHAQPAPGKVMAEQSADELRWNHGENPELHLTGKKTIFGHTTQRTGDVLAMDSGWAVDTFAYGGGWLTSLELPSQTCVQVNQFGEIRTTPL